MVGVPEGKGPQPKWEISQPLLFEFGVLPQNTKHTHSWAVKNVGEGDLEMWMKSSTCSCTIAKLATKEGEETKKVIVKPKDSTTIDLEWETKPGTTPDYGKSATIGTNDLTRPTFTLNVKGKVFPPLVVFPPEMINFSNGVSTEEPAKATVAVFSMDRPETKVTKITTSQPSMMTATHKPLTDEDRKHLNVPTGGERIDLEIKPGLPLGRFHDEMIIETDHPLQQQVKVSITGNAVGPISVIPERVRMFDANGKTGSTHNITLLVKKGRATNFEVVEKPSKLEVKITPYEGENQAGRYRMAVIVPPGTAPGSVDGEIVIKTDHPRAPEVRIPVAILISGGAGP
jgi:hypothetical protein